MEMNNNIYNGEDTFMKFMEFLHSNGQTLDEKGNIVPINEEKGKTLVLTITTEDDEDE